MKKIFTLVMGIIFSITILNSQVAPPQAFSLKATIKNSNGQPVPNKTIRLRISILKDDINGYAVYSEYFTPKTDVNSQVDLQIGRGIILSGIFSATSWSTDTYFLKLEVDICGGTNYQLLSVTQLLSVPYSMYAGSAGNALSVKYSNLIGAPILALVATTGQYKDLSGKPTFATIATSGSYNDLINKPILFNGTWSSLTGKPTFATVATSGSYNDLINKPSLFSGNYNDLSNKPTFEGTWGSLSGKPIFATVATSGSWNDLTNTPKTLAGYGITDAMSISHPANGITTTDITNWNNAFSWGNHAGKYLTISYVPDWNQITNKPTFSEVATSGSYNDLFNLPTLFDGTWGSLTGKPTFSAIAFSGSWKDLVSTPTTLTGYGITDAMNISHPAYGIAATEITNWNTAFSWGNHAGLYRPIGYVPDWSEITGKPTFATVATSSSYNDLINRPTTDGSETKVTAGTNVTVTGSGTTANPYVINSTGGGSVSGHYIGESYGGGIVFYVYDNGQHGLIAATADQSIGIRWFAGTYTYTMARADGVGAGKANTAIIIANQGYGDGATYAARICNEYQVTVGGVTYGDWYLPSKFELNLLFLQKTLVGGFADYKYWSSTEDSGDFVWDQYFDSGGQTYFGTRDSTLPVRAIRAF